SGKSGIRESLLHDALAVIEVAVDGKNAHARPIDDELPLLHRADLSAGVQQYDLDAALPGESVGNRTAGVAGGRHQNGAPFAAPLQEVAHQPGHRARSEVLEGERRPVK